MASNTPPYLQESLFYEVPPGDVEHPVLHQLPPPVLPPRPRGRVKVERLGAGVILGPLAPTELLGPEIMKIAIILIICITICIKIIVL